VSSTPHPASPAEQARDAIAFLEAWAPGQHHSVGAIAPDPIDNEKPTAWLTTNDLAQLAQWIELFASQRRNLYFQPNLCRRTLGHERAGTSDVIVAHAVYVEIDPPKTVTDAASLAAWQDQWTSEIGENPLWQTAPFPTVTIASGTGFQMIWKLHDPVMLWRTVNGKSEFQIAELAKIVDRNRRLVQDWSGDPASVDASRLLRLPGTVNWPDAGKRERGRVPCVARVLDHEPAHVVDLAQLRDDPDARMAMPSRRAARAGDASSTRTDAGLPSTERVEQLVALLGAAWPGRGRHVAQLALAGVLAGRGWPAHAIGRVMDRVARIQEPRNIVPESTRIDVAQRTCDRIDAGESATGWPTLRGMLLEGGSTGATAQSLDQVENVLGISAPMSDEDAAEFLGPALEQARRERFVPEPQTSAGAGGDSPGDDPDAPPARPQRPPPSMDLIRAALRGAAATMRRARDADRLLASEHLQRALKGDLLFPVGATEAERIDAIGRASLAVVCCSPQGTTDNQVATILQGPAGALACDLPDAIGAARRHVLARGPSLAPVAQERRARAAGAGGSGGGAGGGSYPTPPGGRDFARDDDGAPQRDNELNVRIALQALGIDLRYDLFAQRKYAARSQEAIDADSAARQARAQALVNDPEAIGSDGWDDHQILLDTDPVILQNEHVNNLRMAIARRFGVRAGKDFMHDVVDDESMQCSWNPVTEYLQGVESSWDGVARAERWLIDFFGVADTPYARAVSRIVLVAAVRRARQPGCKFDELLVIEGPQGCGKSTGIAALCPRPEWFTDNFPLGADTKLLMEQTRGKWIVEAGELKGMDRSDYASFKAMLSRTTDEARMAYGREVEVRKRQYVPIGTTNEAKYLSDDTGERRVWPVTVGRDQVDVAGIAAIRDQLWAEAAVLERAHANDERYIRLDPSLWDAAGAEQVQRKIDDPTFDQLAGMLGLEGEADAVLGTLSRADVWQLLGFHAERPPNHNQAVRIGSCMRRLGFTQSRRRLRRGGRADTLWARGEGEVGEQPLRLVGGSTQGWNIVPDQDAPAN
jgi:hypothetical protein